MSFNTPSPLRRLRPSAESSFFLPFASFVVSFLPLFLLLFLAGVPLPLWAHGTGDANLSEWHWRPDAFFLLIASGLLYARGWLYLRRRSNRIAKMWQLAAYVTGLISIGIALLSPIDALASTFLSMHMVQHLLLLMIAPLSILLANPLTPFLWGLPTALRHGIGKGLARGSLFQRLLWASTLMPVTWSVYVLNLWVWHHPALYQMALRNEWVHDLQHVLFFSTALLFWWPIVNPSPRLHGEISYGYRLIYLVAATLQNTLLGMAISLPQHVLYPFYASVPQFRVLAPIDDQALGGGIMWVSGHMYLIPIIVLIARMSSFEEESLRRSSPERISPSA